MSAINTILTVGALAATAGLAAWALRRDAIKRPQRPPELERHDLPEPLWNPLAHRPRQRIAGFPVAIREQIDTLIRDGVPYRAIETAMRDAGWPCSHSGLCRYAHCIGVRRRPHSTQSNLENPV